MSGPSSSESGPMTTRITCSRCQRVISRYPCAFCGQRSLTQGPLSASLRRMALGAVLFFALVLMVAAIMDADWLFALSDGVVYSMLGAVMVASVMLGLAGRGERMAAHKARLAKRRQGPKESGLHADGVNGEIHYGDGIILITRKGGLASVTMMGRGEKAIGVDKVTSVQFKEPGPVLNGYIQFAFSGSDEVKGGTFKAASDENSVMFTRAQMPAFKRIRDAVQSEIAGGGGAAGNARNVPVAEELTRLADLRDRGALTDEEFAAEKARVLTSGR